ncbi:MAG: hypothetical protein U1F77_03465 [Kiritimatiellia bacterium]
MITRTYRATGTCRNCDLHQTMKRSTTPGVQTSFLQDQILQCVSQLPAPVQPTVVDNCDTSLTVSTATSADRLLAGGLQPLDPVRLDLHRRLRQPPAPHADLLHPRPQAGDHLPEVPTA